MSRIWDALRQAEREKARGGSRSAREESDRRKNLRHSYTTELFVYGSDADKQPFHEEAETIDANDEGCMIELESPVQKGQRLFLIHPRTQAEQECRVLRVGKRSRGKSRVAVAFGTPAPGFWRR